MISRLLNPKRWSQIAQFFKHHAQQTISLVRNGGIEVLESRIAPAFTATLAGATVSFTGDGDTDTLTITESVGLLQHNRFTEGDADFNSDFDFDTSTPGDQTLAANSASIVNVSAGLGGDTINETRSTDFVAGTISAPGGVINLTTTAGAITRGATGPLTASDLVLTATTGIGAGAGGALDLDVDTLVATTTNATISITEVNDLFIGAINAGTGAVTLAVGGDLLDTNGASLNITGGAVSLSAVNSIAAAADPIEMTATSITATATGGGIWLTNSQALVVNTIAADGDDIEITSTGNMTVNGPVSQTSGDDVNLFASGATAALTLVGSISTDLAGGANGGNITLSAGDLVTLGGGSSISVNGVADVTLNAGYPDAGAHNASADLTLTGALNLGAANLVLTAPRHVILSGAGADITTTGDFTVNADRDGSAAGTGGSFTQNNIASIVQAGNVSITAADVALSGIIDAGTGDIDVQASRNTSNTYLNNSGTGLNLSLADLLALRTDGGEVTIGNATDSGTIFIGGIGTIGLGLVNADYTLNGGSIDFNGGISLQDNRTLTLSSANGVTAGGSGIIDVTINGVSGTLVVSANDDVTLSTLITNLGATTVLTGDITLNNNNSNLTVAAPLAANAVSLMVGTATLTVADTISADVGVAGNITITADGLALNETVSGGGILTIKGNLSTTTIGIGDTASGTLNLDATEIGKILNGFTRINLGATSQIGAVDIVTPAGTPVVFQDPVYITASTTVGSVEIEDGPLVGDADASFNFTAKTITFSGVAPGITTESQTITLNGAMLLGGDTTFDTSAGGNGGDISLTGTINGNQALVINADTAEVFLAGQSPSPSSGTSIGGSARLTTVDVTGGILRLQPNTFSTGQQTYTGSDIRLLGGRYNTSDDGTADILFSGPVTLFNVIGISTNNSTITFPSAVTSEPTGKGGLDLNVNNGSIAFDGDVGTVGIPLKSFRVVSGTTNFGNGAGDDVYVTGELNIRSDEFNFNGGDDSIHVAGPITILARAADTIVLVGGAESGDVNTLSISEDDIGAIADGSASILISRALGTADIIIQATSVFHDPVTFLQRTGGITHLNAELSGDTANGGFIFKGPATRLGADITTGGGLIDIDNGLVVSSAVTFDTSAGGGNIILRGSFRALSGGEDVAIISGTGQIQLTTRIGSASALVPVFGDVILTASGDTRIEKGITAASVLTNGGGTTFTKGSILTIENGGQEYLDAVQLSGASQFISQDDFGAIHFHDTVNSAPGKTYDLGVTNRTPFAAGTTVEFDANVGDIDRVRSLRINTTGNVVFDSGIKAASIISRTDSITIQSADTTLTQSYIVGGTPGFLGAINASKLTITTTSNVANVGAWTVSGQLKITAPGASVNISGAGNHFGNISLRAASATIVEDGNMNIFSATISGTLNLTTNTFGLENGDLSQTNRIIAQRLETSVTGIAGSITLNYASNRIAQIGDLTAGGDIQLVDRSARFASLDGAITTANGDIQLVANPFGYHGSFSSTTNASLSAGGGGRWTIYSYYGSSIPLNYDLFVQFGPDNIAVVAHPGANPFPTGNSILYILTGQP